MVKTEEIGVALTPSYTTECIISTEYVVPETANVTLDKDELNNIIEFIELNFIESIRNDTYIDNIDYIVSVVNALQKLRSAHNSLKKEESKND